MGMSAVSVAKEFLKRAKAENKTLTNMQLQKLVFLAHGFSLGIFQKPLFSDDVKAWQWGPVIPRLYNRLKKYGDDVVPDFIQCESGDEGEPDASERALIDAVWKSYGDYSGAKLSGITHQEGSPWSQTWATAPFQRIPEASIAAYYKPQDVDDQSVPQSATANAAG